MADDVFETVPCPICGRCEGISITERGQHGLPAHVRICPNDGMVWLSPRWTKERYARFYRDEYDDHYRPSVGHRADEAERELAEARGEEIARRLEPHLPARASVILEVGAGLGGPLNTLARRYPAARLLALEASPRCVERLRAEVGAQIVATEFDSEWDLDIRRTTDIVIMRHVLEHLLDVRGALARVQELLAPEGLAYIAVPDMMNPRGEPTEHWFRSVHVWYFARATLLQLAAEAGLKPVAFGESASELWMVLTRGSFEAPDLTAHYPRQRAALERWMATSAPTPSRPGPLRAARRAVRRLRRLLMTAR